ncbi:MAG: histidine--tRNA ligase [Planctomycetota bacterium]|nr:MAG: histidine--tRNA ligase [Planctomycetota bacterium]
MAGPAFRAPRGTRDWFPEDLVIARFLEETARATARAYRYAEVRPPLLEETRLYTRSLGETSDVVSKEMFTVPSRADEGVTYTFRPEGTAGVARAYVEGGYPARAPFQKWYYVGPMFRYERPQKGRERQFTQFGVEAFGSASPRLDAEVVDLACAYFERLGLEGELQVRLNTMGDSADRERWRDALAAYFAPQLARRCEDCRARFQRNVFRLLDCKVEACRQLNASAPSVRAALGPESAAHFAAVVAALQRLGRSVVDDPAMVRGLDYYTRTVFEVHFPPLGARSALCGGGRYDNLVSEVGGPVTPAVGFAAGFTATELALAELGRPDPARLERFRTELGANVYLVAIGTEDRDEVFRLAGELRAAGVSGVDLDYRDKSSKAQFKEADRLGARLVVVIGPEERSRNRAVVRDMQSGTEENVARTGVVPRLQEVLQP